MEVSDPDIAAEPDKFRKVINVANEPSKEIYGAPTMAEAKPLTAKMENFAQAIASGSTQTDAYRAVYSASKMTTKTIWEKAARLAAHDMVRARIFTLRADLADRQLWTRAQSVEALKRALDLAEEFQLPAAMTCVVKELNNMHGFNEPKKLDLNVAAAARTITPEMTPQEAAEVYAAMLNPGS